MTSNQRQAGEVSITIPVEQSNFIREERKKFQSALLEAKNQLENSSSQNAKPLIQRVPPVLLRAKEDFGNYFEPRLVALGPLHHGKPKFEPAEQSKLKLAALFADENGTTDFALFHKIKEGIEDLKKCYNPEDIKNYDDEKLAWMFFVDGCAVLYAVHHGLQGKLKKLGIKADLLVLAQLDLFLLENQLPYRVFNILIGGAKKPQDWKNSMKKFMGENLVTNIPSKQKSPQAEGQEDGEESPQAGGQEDGEDYAHLLERLRAELLRGEGENESSSSMIGKMFLACGESRKVRKKFRSIKELKESGINVKPSKTTNLKNISFYCNFLGRLKMPHLLVDDSTASKLMNLVALEMCPDFGNDFAVTSYLCFLDYLIDTAQDVKELRAAGVLHNYLGSDEEVADLFNKMSGDLVPDQQIYNDVIENIHNYCNNRLTTEVAHAYYTHFSSPWTFLAFLGAILGLLFSAVQTFFSLPHKRSS